MDLKKSNKKLLDKISFDKMTDDERTKLMARDKKGSKFDSLFTLMLPRYYNPPELFFESFYTFAENLDSLQRYFEYTERYIEEYLIDSHVHLQSFRTSNPTPAEYFDTYGGMYYSDKKYFTNNHLSNILSSLFSLLEKLIEDVAREIALEQGIKKVDLPSQQMPYINKYLYFLKNNCGIDIKIDKETNKKLDMIRHIRNKYIHELGNHISKEIAQELNNLLDKTNTENFTISHEFIELSFETISDIARIIEKKYIAFWQTINIEGVK